MRKKIAVKIVVFMLIFTAITMVISEPLTKIDKDGYEIISSFYEEEENTLDAVYIGSSNCFTFWNSLLAWKNYGIAVHAYAANSNPFISAEYLIRDARKTQPDALYIVNINTTDEKFSISASRNVLDSMPLSVNKLNFISYICKTNNYSLGACLEFYFPLIRFHSRWSELTSKDFNKVYNCYKGSTLYFKYLKSQVDVSSSFSTSDEEDELSRITADAIESLLDYCREEQVKVLFVTVPQARDEKTVTKFNAINSLISESGFDVLDFTEMSEELGISYKTDYYNEKHTNIHGSVKFTEYFAEYLMENYGFTDKRDDERYSSWYDALNDYSEEINPYLLDFETEFEERNYSLSQPALKITEKSGEKLLSWTVSEGADGYLIYRKNGTGAWERIEDTSGTELTVTQPKKDSSYYTVVPYTVSDGIYSYGNFSYTGIELSATK